MTVHAMELPDGRKAEVRAATPADLDGLVRFFGDLPDSTRLFLRYNVRDRALTARRLDQIDGVEHWRLVAVVDGAIVGDATMDREAFGWTRHVAELRVVLCDEFEPLGLREFLSERMLDLARGSDVEVVQTEVLAERKFFIKLMESLGFRKEVVRRRHAKGMDGRLHDVVVMSNDIDAVWRHLEQHMHDMDHCATQMSGKG
jgi:L-amino acid N-acyltransferase YncA